MLSAKYLIDSHILQENNYRGASYSWKSIVKAVANLKQGFITRVGKGDIPIWYKKWLHKGKICDRIPFVDIQDINLKINDVCQYGKWNFDQLTTQLPIDIKLEMQSIFINTNYEDLLFWEPASSITYSTESAYFWLTQNHTPPLPPHQSWPWV